MTCQRLDVFLCPVFSLKLLTLPQLFSLYLPFVLISLYSLNKSPQCHSALQIKHTFR